MLCVLRASSSFTKSGFGSSHRSPRAVRSHVDRVPMRGNPEAAIYGGGASVTGKKQIHRRKLLFLYGRCLSGVPSVESRKAELPYSCSYRVQLMARESERHQMRHVSLDVCATVSSRDGTSQQKEGARNQKSHRAIPMAPPCMATRMPHICYVWLCVCRLSKVGAIVRTEQVGSRVPYVPAWVHPLVLYHGLCRGTAERRVTLLDATSIALAVKIIRSPSPLPQAVPRSFFSCLFNSGLSCVIVPQKDKRRPLPSVDDQERRNCPPSLVRQQHHPEEDKKGLA